MKKLAVIAAVVFTTLTVQSCRQSDDVLTPEEIATLQKVQDSSTNSIHNNSTNTINNNQGTGTPSNLDGEILPPPRR